MQKADKSNDNDETTPEQPKADPHAELHAFAIKSYIAGFLSANQVNDLLKNAKMPMAKRIQFLESMVAKKYGEQA